MHESIAQEAESIVRSLLDEWLTPRRGECLACFVQRAVEAFGCDGLRFAKRYRDLVAPRATALERRLASSGGHCDCEYLMHVVEPAGLGDLDPTPPDAMPRCTGVRPGSTQPCSNWATLRRPRWLPGRGWC
ncbi:DUF2695 domain-containing protein [Agrococcus sp. 1P02AA]|uniref:DUF2695 domain-containing protein n=1 Tax=Agrococcus sp. 1P02AA TaxID=3132259 RepID=UPI0039A5E2A5